MIDTSLILVLSSAIGVVAWVFIGVAQEMRRRIARRVADVVLPDDQPWTFSLAFVLVGLAISVAPSRYWVLNKGTLFRGLPSWDLTTARAYKLEWLGGQAAAEELSENLRSGRPSINPIREVLPLLRIAIGFRLRNLVILPLWAVTILAEFLMLLAVAPVAFLFIPIDKRIDRHRNPEARQLLAFILCTLLLSPVIAPLFAVGLLTQRVLHDVASRTGLEADHYPSLYALLHQPTRH